MGGFIFLFDYLVVFRYIINWLIMIYPLPHEPRLQIIRILAERPDMVSAYPAGDYHRIYFGEISTAYADPDPRERI